MRTALFALAALLLLPLSGCDEATGLDDAVDVVVEDAVVARQQGNFAKAVTLLEGAIAREPGHAGARVELATTLLERDGIDLLDLDRIAQFLLDETGSSSQARASGLAGCSSADQPGATTLDLSDAYGFTDIQSKIETLERADETLEPVIPRELRSSDVYSSVVQVDGKNVLQYDRDQAIQKLRAQGLSDAKIARALASNALAQFLEAYIFIATELPQEATWYRLASGSIRVCAADEYSVLAKTAGAVAQADEAVLSLDARAHLIGSSDSVAAEVVQVVLDAYEDLIDAINDSSTAR